jgi:hypothetical protein
LKILRITSKQIATLESFLATKQKIKAIKYLRDLSGAGLREAKDAVDQLAGAVLKSPTAKVQLPWTVDSIKVTSPSGKAYELSTKELELKFLQETSSIGMNEVADLLDLTNFIKEWSGNS